MNVSDVQKCTTSAQNATNNVNEFLKNRQAVLRLYAKFVVTLIIQEADTVSKKGKTNFDITLFHKGDVRLMQGISEIASMVTQTWGIREFCKKKLNFIVITGDEMLPFKKDDLSTITNIVKTELTNEQNGFSVLVKNTFSIQQLKDDFQSNIVVSWPHPMESAESPKEVTDQ